MALKDVYRNLKWKAYIVRQKRRILAGERKNYADRKSFLERDMLVLAHSLEKGMGIPDPRKGYGKEKAYNLVCTMKEYGDKYDTDCFPYQESFRVLETYIDLMKSQKVRIRKIEAVKNELKKNISGTYELEAGYDQLSYEQLSVVTPEELEKIYSTRHSIRHFSKEIISEEELHKVIGLANRAPSACNRQPVRLYHTVTQEKAAEFENIIDGSHGFKGETPYYMLVTVDRAYFAGDEYLQWYTNGGIYLAYLNLAFHACGIGSIILQWKYANEKEQTIKDYFGIMKSEAIIAVIGYGKYPKDGTKCIKAQRKSVEDTLVTH